MSRLLTYLLSVRGIVAAGLVAATCWFSSNHVVHHTPGEDPYSVFPALHAHVMPEPLVKDNHAKNPEPLLELPLPGFLGAFHHEGKERISTEEGPKTAIFNLQLFQITAVLLVFVLMSGVPGYLRTSKGDPISRLFAGFCMWIRDEMVYPQMGREMGRKFLPYFLCVFFFIAFMNLMGLTPLSATPTASIFVTAALAVTTFVAMIAAGMAVQGPVGFIKGLVPHVPGWLWLPMLGIELIGLVVKPFALMVRLFANISGGHLVVLSFMGLIFFMGTWVVAPMWAGLGIFVMIIEVFVALVQAYIFTQLSIIFINASVHPEH